MGWVSGGLAGVPLRLDPTLPLPIVGIAISGCRVINTSIPRLPRQLIYRDIVSLDRGHSVPTERDRHFQHRARTTGLHMHLVSHAEAPTTAGSGSPEILGAHTLGSRMLRPHLDKRDSREWQLVTSFRKRRPQVTLQSFPSHRVWMTWTLTKPTTHPLKHP